MTDLSREELRAHLSAVEAQVRAALRIIAAESKSVQQAHGALRADLSAALIRLQSDMNSGQSDIQTKLDRALAEVNALNRTRKLTTAILTALVLVFGILTGVLAGGSWHYFQQVSQNGPAGPAAAAQAEQGPTTATEPNSTPTNSFILEGQDG